MNDNQMDALISVLTRIAEVLESIDDNTIGIDGALRELVCLATDAAENN